MKSDKPTLEEDLAYLRNLEQFQRVTEQVYEARESYIEALSGGEGERTDAKVIGAMKAYNEIYRLFKGR